MSKVMLKNLGIWLPYKLLIFGWTEMLLNVWVDYTLATVLQIICKLAYK